MKGKKLLYDSLFCNFILLTTLIFAYQVTNKAIEKNRAILEATRILHQFDTPQFRTSSHASMYHLRQEELVGKIDKFDTFLKENKLTYFDLCITAQKIENIKKMHKILELRRDYFWIVDSSEEEIRDQEFLQRITDFQNKLAQANITYNTLGGRPWVLQELKKRHKTAF